MHVITVKTCPIFWVKAVLTANYIRNRSSIRSINGDIPYTKWTSKKPTVKYFLFFGTKGLMLNTDLNIRKFDLKCKECIFLGYSSESKAYKRKENSKKKKCKIFEQN